MKECPKCGELDDPHWRPRIFDFEVDFCHLSDLEAKVMAYKPEP